MYEPRFYREWNNNKLKKFNVSYRETDLLIKAPVKLSDICFQVVRNLRQKLDNYISVNNEFIKSLTPVKIPAGAPVEVQEMSESSKKVGVGPMAAVAGLFAEKVGQAVLELTDEVIVENGGDIYLAVKEEHIIGLYAGQKSPFSGKLGIKIEAGKTPLGICTSAGTVGPSLSMGSADAVVVISQLTTLADAAATAIGNRIKKKEDIQSAIDWAKNIHGIDGIIIIKNENIGVWGDITLVQTDSL